MPALTIINGVCSVKINKMVEQSAFLEGLLTCSLKDYIKGNINRNNHHILLFLDSAAIHSVSGELIKVLLINRLSIILIADERNIFLKNSCRKELPFEYIPENFSHREFRETVIRHVDQRVWNDRTMVFGDLEIERAYREVRFCDEVLDIKGFSYMILLMLAEHTGEVVSREAIIQNLPARKRSSLRNIDTHIKQIRQNKGMEQLIRCVRPIGYCLAPDPLYQNT